MDDKHVPILVVSVDIGTTYSRFAYLFKSQCLASPDAKSVHWPNGQDKAPTVVLFNQNRVFDSFGYDAELKYSELVSEGEHEDWYFFQRFKLKLNEMMDTEDINLSDACGKNMPASTVLAAVIKAMRVRMVELLEIKNTLIEDGDILWVFNVPGRWSGSAHRLLKKASHEAGIPDDKMMIVLDPVAASLFYDTTHGEEAITPQYMVLDVGGGTIDITVLEKQNYGSITAVYHSSSKIASLFDVLWLMLGDTVGHETLQSLQKEKMMECIQMERELEIITLAIRNVISFKPPADLCKAINIKRLTTHHPMPANLKVIGDKIRLDGSLFKEHLSDSFDKIRNQLNKAVEQPLVVGTRVCLMVGALSKSDYLISFLKQKIPSLKFVNDKNPQFVNVIGAAMLGYKPKLVSWNIHTTETDDINPEQGKYSNHDTSETEVNSGTDNTVQRLHNTFTVQPESVEKGILDFGKAIDSFICRFEKTDVCSNQNLKDLKERHCTAIESLNASFEQTLTEKQNQDREHRSLYTEMQQLKGEIICKQQQLEEDVVTLTKERNDFKERAVDSEKKYNTILTEVTKLKQENQHLSLDVSKAQFQVAQTLETISSLQNELDKLNQYKKEKDTSEKQLICDIHSLRASLVKEQETLAKLVTEKENMKSRLRESESRSSLLETQYQQAESKVDEKLQILQQMGLAVSRHAEMELSFKQQISKLKEENKTLQQRERNLLAQIEMMTGGEEKEMRDNDENAVSSNEDRPDTQNVDEVPGRSGEICNLSVPNRATRLCKRFSDLFHEDWPVALEYLTISSFTHKEAVGCLLSLLQVCFNSCKKASKTQLQILTRALLHPVGTLSDSASNTAQSVQ